jgi:hypothetical protein
LSIKGFDQLASGTLVARMLILFEHRFRTDVSRFHDQLSNFLITDGGYSLPLPMILIGSTPPS